MGMVAGDGGSGGAWLAGAGAAALLGGLVAAGLQASATSQATTTGANRRMAELGGAVRAMITSLRDHCPPGGGSCDAPRPMAMVAGNIWLRQAFPAAHCPCLDPASLRDRCAVAAGIAGSSDLTRRRRDGAAEHPPRIDPGVLAVLE